MTTEEEAFGARTDTADFIVVEEGPALDVNRIDLAHFEEIDRFPLQLISILVSNLRLH